MPTISTSAWDAVVSKKNSDTPVLRKSYLPSCHSFSKAVHPFFGVFHPNFSHAAQSCCVFGSQILPPQHFLRAQPALFLVSSVASFAIAPEFCQATIQASVTSTPLGVKSEEGKELELHLDFIVVGLCCCTVAIFGVLAVCLYLCVILMTLLMSCPWKLHEDVRAVAILVSIDVCFIKETQVEPGGTSQLAVRAFLFGQEALSRSQLSGARAFRHENRGKITRTSRENGDLLAVIRWLQTWPRFKRHQPLAKASEPWKQMMPVLSHRTTPESPSTIKSYAIHSGCDCDLLSRTAHGSIINMTSLIAYVLLFYGLKYSVKILLLPRTDASHLLVAGARFTKLLIRLLQRQKIDESTDI
ncbi:uncharacterized protein MYCFIDRAFT_177203 [Pseudocercospora fijiensis CIRAD86]|uniref:Uncharacterized protein n=1 Tax=Pseudocercospora fijiensis (strain CIRAD86) TaxID=383855 RepID=M2YRC5_PSEFD|nr:uncharacterized protein MYCFIDRAFT_177203 [Pseudocercospora fijiensis CIRAD86]EME80240.1 hypothetical protein MYCFIDRAFT_177203 [Pseudocercospora fijiensis CIRAD86]